MPIAIKALLVAVLAHGFGAPTGVAARTGIYLAQAGEFGFVLLTLGLSNGLIDPLWSNPVLAAMVLSMVATPFLIHYADRLVYRFAAEDWLSQSLNITSLAQHTITIDHHVIICGFGRTGKNLCNLLESEAIGYLALDLHPDVVHAAMLAGHRVEYGDATQLAHLMSAGLARASAVVVSYDDTASALKVLELVQAQGAALYFGNQLILVGETPGLSEVQSLLTWFADYSQQEVFSSTCLGKLYPAAKDFQEETSGLLAISIRLQKTAYYLLWFRPEVIKIVNWAGDPSPLETVDAIGKMRPSPRRSFEVWKESVRGMSVPWQSVEL
jgi:hypothetical protein